MDGTKRQANGLPVPSDKPIDLGATPPWALPPVYHEESALRFTQSPEFNLTINPAALHAGSPNIPRSLPAWTALNASPTLQARSNSRKQIGKAALPVVARDIDSANDDDDESIICGVDIDNGRDGVYMLNAAEGSWSGSLAAEDDPEVRATLPDSAVLVLKHLKRAQQLAEEQQFLTLSEDEAAEAERHGSDVATVIGNATEDWQRPPDEFRQVFTTQDDYEEEKRKWHRDLLLRNIVRRIKSKLNSGAVLTLERLGPVNATMTCAHPDCPAPDRRIPPGAYYIILGQPRQLESAERFCLFCLEWLWNGRGMCKPLPNPEVTPQQDPPKLTVSGLSLDGAMDDDRLLAAGMKPESASPGTPVSRQSSMPQSPFPPTPVTEHSSGCLPSPPKTTATEHSRVALLTESPTAKSGKHALISREARDLMEGFGEAFLDGQSLVAQKHGDVANQAAAISTRRSARLQPSANAANASPEVGNRVARPLHNTRVSAVSSGRATATDTAMAEVAKAEKKLEEMYKQRDLALTSLGPGQTAVVKHPKCPKIAAKHTVNIDQFGVAYTDLLAEPATKYWTQENANVSKGSRTEDQTTDKLYSSHSLGLRTRQEEHWCVCHGIDDGSEMIRCANERCLVGWYHTECVGVSAESDDDDDSVESATPNDTEADVSEWICELCTIYGQAGTKTLRSCLVSAEQVEKIFAPSHGVGSYAQNMDVKRTSVSETTLLSLDVVGKQHDVGTVPQFDGSSESPRTPGVPEKNTPPPPSHLYGIPASLLSSKHAPSLEELACYPLAVQYPRPSSPPRAKRADTPGGPYTPKSTTSAGAWHHPPTRFQHLAAYVKAGNSLDGSEKAAVAMWKVASDEQVRWEKHLERAEKMRGVSVRTGDEDDASEHADDSVSVMTGGDKLEEGEILEESNGHKNRSGERVNVKCNGKSGEQDDSTTDGEDGGPSKSDCRGKDLTAVLAEARSRRAV